MKEQHNACTQTQTHTPKTKATTTKKTQTKALNSPDKDFKIMVKKKKDAQKTRKKNG